MECSCAHDESLSGRENGNEDLLAAELYRLTLTTPGEQICTLGLWEGRDMVVKGRKGAARQTRLFNLWKIHNEILMPPYGTFVMRFRNVHHLLDPRC